MGSDSKDEPFGKKNDSDNGYRIMSMRDWRDASKPYVIGITFTAIRC